MILKVIFLVLVAYLPFAGAQDSASCGTQALTCLNDGFCMGGTDPTTQFCNCTGTGFEGTEDCGPEPTTPDGRTGGGCGNGSESTNPCQNGGICTPSTGELFECTCAPGFIGLECEFEVCSGTTCENAGTCENVTNQDTNMPTFRCTCSDDFDGDRCETPITCIDDPCENEATCNDVANPGSGQPHYSCSCTEDFTGIVCETLLTCNERGCENGGICEQTTDSQTGETEYNCNCSPDFKGDRCETPVTCDDSPCANSGNCSAVTSPAAGDAHYKCDCDLTFAGKRCENPVSCGGTLANGTVQMCQNKGTCINQTSGGITTFKCNCKCEFYGLQCENYVCDPSNHNCGGWRRHCCPRCPRYCGPKSYKCQWRKSCRRWGYRWRKWSKWSLIHRWF